MTTTPHHDVEPRSVTVRGFYIVISIHTAGGLAPLLDDTLAVFIRHHVGCRIPHPVDEENAV